jgi:peptide/nickel transport system ATP-binding protein
MKALIEVDALRISLPGRADAIGPISFAVEAGGGLGLVGESGSGKSLSLLALLDLLPPGARATGHVVFDGTPYDLSRGEQAALRGRGVGLVFQDALASLHPLRTIGSQLVETLRLREPRLSAAAARQQALEALERVGLDQPEALFDRVPHRLSGGQRQRAMIALALATQPRALFADEPTSALDVQVQRGILDLLLQLKRELGIALVFVGHDLDVVGTVCESLLVLRHGRVLEHGPRDDVLRSPQHEYTRRLIAAQHVPARSRDENIRSLTSTPAAPLLSVEDLTVRYPGRDVDAVVDAAFSLRRGETLALVGESGSGKSTLGRAVLQLQQAAIGSQVNFDGVELTALSSSALKPMRRRMQIVFQDPYASLDPRQRVTQILAEPLRIHRLPHARARLVELLAAVELDATHLDRYPHEFSGGQRQRIAIARALATDPDLLLCDEAVSALDALVRAQILALLERLRRDRGLALLFITHDLGVAAALSDRIAVMHRGQIVEQGECAQVLQFPQHAYTRALLAAGPGAGVVAAEGAEVDAMRVHVAFPL